jgi:hypothetical protein
MFSAIHKSLIIFCTVLLSGIVQAATPENGFWWNRAEGGRGYSIEVQDNYLFFAGFLYDNSGNATWYTTQGLLESNGNFVGTLTSGRGGQCINCSYVAPVYTVGSGGPISINFTSEVEGTLSWGSPSRTIPITRFDYYYTRTAPDQQSDLLRGEWQMTLDYTGAPGANLASYYGDAIIFTSVNRTSTTFTVNGCRSLSSAARTCTGARAAYGYLSGTDQHIFVVDNDSTTQTVYSLRVGLTQLRGTAKTCAKTLSVANCLSTTSVYAVPVRGFRTKSNAYVNGGSGPSSMLPLDKSAVEKPGLPMVQGDAGAANAALELRMAQEQ